MFGESYPIRDKCNSKGDPPGGCLTMNALYSTITVSLNFPNSISLYTKDRYYYLILFFGPSTSTRTIFRNLEKESYSPEEYKEVCTAINGTFFDCSLCDVSVYLSRLYFRLGIKITMATKIMIHYGIWKISTMILVVR